MQELLAEKEVQPTVGHMCRHGMRMTAPGGVLRLVRKPTRWASSAPEVLRRVALRCRNEGRRPGNPGWHQHVVVEGPSPGERAGPGRQPGTRQRCTPRLCGHRGPAGQRGAGPAITCEPALCRREGSVCPRAGGVSRDAGAGRLGDGGGSSLLMGHPEVAYAMDDLEPGSWPPGDGAETRGGREHPAVGGTQTCRGPIRVLGYYNRRYDAGRARPPG